VDRIDGVTEDRGFVEKMDGVVQAGDWSESGGVCKSSGGPSLLSSSDPVEAGQRRRGCHQSWNNRLLNFQCK